jgi:large conductance mechanosensitive channel
MEGSAREGAPVFGRFAGSFRQFMLRGNVFEFMVAFAIAGEFANLVRTFVQFSVTPVLALAVQKSEIDALTFTIQDTVFRYGIVVNAILSFVFIAAAVYVVVLVANQIAMHSHHAQPVDPTLRNCPECLSEIPRRARRCSFCTAEVRPFVTERDPAA